MPVQTLEIQSSFVNFSIISRTDLYKLFDVVETWHKQFERKFHDKRKCERKTIDPYTEIIHFFNNHNINSIMRSLMLFLTISGILNLIIVMNPHIVDLLLHFAQDHHQP